MTLIPVGEEKLAKLHEMHEQGVPLHVIADRLDLSIRTVQQHTQNGKTQPDEQTPQAVDDFEIASKNKRCRTCKYRSTLGSNKVICMYIAITYNRRGCPVSNCNRYVKGDPIPLKMFF